MSTAFLHALITGEDIRVIPPSEFYPDGNTVWKLKRALYGLRNAPRLWQDHFASVVEKNNFRRMKSDPNLYVRRQKRLYILCYVDDLMFFGSQPDIQAAISDLSKDLILKVSGRLTDGKELTFLGADASNGGMTRFNFTCLTRISRTCWRSLNLRTRNLRLHLCHLENQRCF